MKTRFSDIACLYQDIGEIDDIFMKKQIQDALGQVSAVLFDFDGVILDSEWPIYETWKNLFAREGQVLESEMYAQCIGSDFDTWSPQSYLESLTGKSYEWERENAQRQVILEADLEESPPMDGVRELLSFLQDTKTAVVSSSTHSWVDRWIEKLELDPYFEALVCRGDAPRIKPAPDLYLEAARRLGVSPSECLVIEDSMNGLISAKTAGMQVLVVPNRLTRFYDFAEADYQVNYLTECLVQAVN